jgi:hypothetical protein
MDPQNRLYRQFKLFMQTHFTSSNTALRQLEDPVPSLNTLFQKMKALPEHADSDILRHGAAVYLVKPIQTLDLNINSWYICYGLFVLTCN